jgi:hypothetical protein
MDKWQAQNSFWNSFGIPAWEEHSVPDNQKNVYPRITYEAATATFETLVPITASIWDKSTSWATADTLANTIESYIKSMGCPEVEGGRYRVFIGDTTFAQKMDDPADDQIKRILLNVTFEFMTN